MKWLLGLLLTVAPLFSASAMQVCNGDGSSCQDLGLATNRSFTYPTRALNTCWQINADRDASVTYSVAVGAPLSLTAGTTGTLYLRVYTDSACTLNQQTITQGSNSLTGTLVVGLALLGQTTVYLRGSVPKGMYVRIETENTVGSPTFTIKNPSQEVLL